MQCPSLSLFTTFISKSILSDMSIATSAFFWSLFVWDIFSQPLTFSLYVSLVSRWVYCRQHIQRSYFCIHSASLCLLVGAFNPFTFKVIIDKYDPIAIYFIVLGSSLYALSVFPIQRRSFSICWRAGLVVLNSLSFCLSAKLLISPSYLNEVLAGYSNLGCRLFSFITHSSPAEFNRSQKDPTELQLRNSFFGINHCFMTIFYTLLLQQKLNIASCFSF